MTYTRQFNPVTGKNYRTISHTHIHTHPSYIQVRGNTVMKQWVMENKAWVLLLSNSTYLHNSIVQLSKKNMHQEWYHYKITSFTILIKPNYLKLPLWNRFLGLLKSRAKCHRLIKHVSEKRTGMKLGNVLTREEKRKPIIIRAKIIAPSFLLACEP